ncbi:hypothetical protein [Altererythrobacter sp. MF3-039]
MEEFKIRNGSAEGAKMNERESARTILPGWRVGPFLVGSDTGA